jgi:3-isopropylmalate/(R)-2-methylmalate dehydratase large subunit
MSTTLFDKVGFARGALRWTGCVLLIAISFMKLPVLLLLGLKERGISVLYPERTFTADHNTPTINQHLPVEDPLSANQLHLEENSKEYGISHWGLGNKKMESFMSWVLKTELHYLALLLFAEIHTSTHGAFGAIVLGLVLLRNGPFYAM